MNLKMPRSIPHAQWLAAGLGTLSLLIGGLLVKRAGTSTAGSPLGWLLIALGIVGLLIAVGIVAGAYRE
jgi:hypothetical protein